MEIRKQKQQLYFLPYLKVDNINRHSLQSISSVGEK